jgi:flagellar M-ring protein FliF
MAGEDQVNNNLSALVRNAPAVRQVLLLVGLAASIAIGISGALWLRDPGFTTLYANVSDTEAADIVGTLQASGIPYELDRRTGAIMVPPAQVHEARLSLASAGLPRGAGFGLEMIQESSGITASQFMENARYHHALETELARTVGNLRPVQSARVHLALPRSTVFLRDKKSPSASVLVYLYPGRTLEPSQVASIVYLVASSIPDLEASRVTVVDQNGKLLSESNDSDELAQTQRQFDYVRRLETSLSDRIVSLLTPVVGPERVRASVAADVDFTVQEEAREQYDPANSVVRSEQIQENRNVGAAAGPPAGVPGALSNTPPQVGAQANPNAVPNAPAAEPVNESIRETRNYELDRTMSVTRRQAGTLTRLSIAVVLDEAATALTGADADAGDADGAAAATGAGAALLAEVEALVRRAVGFDEARGDTITITTAPFYEPPPPPEIEAASFLSSPGFRSIAQQVLSIAAIVLVGWGVARPIVRMITAPPSPPDEPAMLAAGGGAAVALGQLTYDQKVSAVRQLVDQDSERVARIVKQWVGSDG